MSILTLNLLFSTLVFWIAIRLYILPKIEDKGPQVLVPILLLHSTRHLGLMFLASGATYPGMPSQFAYPAAFGDVVAALLALISVYALSKHSSKAYVLVWVFNLFGTLDLLLAITMGTIYDAEAYMGPSYWIPALWVPALLVTHAVTFILLWRHRRGPSGLIRDNNLSR